METKDVYADSRSALIRLAKNNILSQSDTGTGIIVLKHSVPIGIKLWGAIDYLIRHGDRTGWVRETKR